MRLKHQRRIEAESHFLRKPELECIQLIQQLNQLETEIQHSNNILENTKKIHSTSRKVPPKQVATSETSILTPFVVHVNTEREKQAFIMDVVCFTEILI